MSKTPRSVIAKVIAERSLTLNPHMLSEQIAAYLAAEGRTAELQPLLRDIIAIRAEHGIIEVNAVTARPLTSEGRADVEAQVRARYPEAKHIVVSEEIRETTVAGVRIEYPDSQLDVSVRAKLNRFKQLTAHGA